MDAIKKKMQSLKSETDNALSRAEELDGEAKEATLRAEKYEETVSVLFHDLEFPFFFKIILLNIKFLFSSKISL